MANSQTIQDSLRLRQQQKFISAVIREWLISTNPPFCLNESGFDVSNPSLSEQIGRLFGQQDLILDELKDAKDDRKQHYSTIEEIRGSMIKLDNRMTSVEGTLTKYNPTIDEFIQLKQKVLGAGKLGKWLWIAVVALIGLAFKLRIGVFSWVGK